MSAADSYRFRVGDLECIAISDGTSVVPVEGMVKDVPPEEWRQALAERGYPTVETPHYYNCLYLDVDGSHVLVDAGWGRGVQRRDGMLVEHLLGEGIAPSDVDVMVISHFDPDHVSGIATASGELTFPNADYVLLEEAWDFWGDESRVAALPEPRAAIGRRALALIQGRLEVVAAGVEFLPGLVLIPAPGHRPGHTVLAATSRGEHLLHLADAVGHPLLMERPAWWWSFDGDRARAEADRRRLLGQAAEQHALVFGSHLPFPGLGHVTREGDGWRWEPVDSGVA